MTTTKTLRDALLAFQGEAPTLPKDKTNPHYNSKFTPLDTIVEKINPLLTKHGLIWSTLPGRTAEGEPVLHYRLAHSGSEDMLEGTMPLFLGKRDAQSYGSALTYARRYCVTTVLNLVADEDEDGNVASRQQSSGPPLGPEYEEAVKKACGAACTTLAGGEALDGIALFKAVRKDCGEYMPQAAALALIRAAEMQPNAVPHVEAPEAA